MWKRFIGLVWDPGYSPVDPGFGGGIGAPGDPGYGHPAWGGRPDNSLPGAGHPSQGLPWAPGHPSTGPIYGGGHPGNKPPGRPIIPIHPGNKPPNSGLPPHPGWPGHWEPVDPGFGLPPLWAFFPVDPGFGAGPGTRPDQGLPIDPVTPGTPLPTPPVHVSGQPVPPSGGNWVPTDPDYGIPDRCPGGRPHPPLWGWIPTPPDLSKPIELPPETPAPK